MNGIGIVDDSRFEHDGLRQRVTVGAAAAQIVRFENDRGKIHRSDRIAGKHKIEVFVGVRSRIDSEMILLAAENRFGRHQIREAAFPTFRQCAAVKVDHETVFGGIFQNFQIIADHRLFFRVEEVYFQSFDAQRGQFLHLRTADFPVGHFVAGRFRHGVVFSAGIVPEPDIDFVAGCINQSFDFFIRIDSPRIPVGVNQ